MTVLSISRLRCLRELANQGSIAAAADALWLTPSAVSQQLAALQRETNVQLIEKSGRGVTLTPAGRTLVEHAERVFAELESAEAALSTISHEPSGCVRVATLPSLVRLTASVMDDIRSDYGGLSFEIEDLESADGLVALDCGRVDVAIVDEGDWRELKRGGLRLEATHLFDDPLVVAYKPGHELAEPESLDWSAMASQRWIVGQPAWAFLNPVYEHCRQAGFEPNVIAHVRDRSAALGLVGQGWGICVIPRLVVAGQSDGVAWRQVEPTLYRTSVAVTRQSGTNMPAIHSLLERLRRAAEEFESAAIS